MLKKCGLFWILLCLGITLLFTTSAAASPPSQSIPAGFSLILSDTGVSLYEKIYPGGNPDYVQVVRLDQGAGIVFNHGEIINPGTGKGVYGGNSPSFDRQNLQEIWDQAASAGSSVFCVTNGQFFSTDNNPTPLAFPLKKDGVMVSDGYGISEYPDQKLILQLWGSRAEIAPLTWEALHSSTAPDILAGLTEDADKGPANDTGRTFVGIDDSNGDGTAETVLIFNSKTARQTGAAQVLRDFGADRVIMLDGGGSTQLRCRSGALIESSREIPQSIVVLSQPAPPLSAEVLEQPRLPVLVEGESLEVRVEIRNAGQETWTTGSFRLINLKNAWGAPAELPLTADIPPGEAAVFTWTTEPFTAWGIHSTRWMMSKAGQSFDEAVDFSVVVLPEKMAEQKRELEEKIKEWTDQQMENIEQRVREWMQQQAQNLIQRILQWIQGQLENIFGQICGVSSMALPAAGVFLVFRRRRRQP